MSDAPDQPFSASDSPAACVVGWPVAHSRSPLIHRYWLRELGIAGDYRREAVRPDEFDDFLTTLSARGYVGANVTVPHKERALTLAEADARARAIGAANTLWFDRGRLCATNTDVDGFLANLDAAAPDWDVDAEAVVLGAGGSSRSVVFGLLSRGISRIYLINRTLERAVAMEAAFGSRVVPTPWRDATKVLAAAGLLVNTTSLGMIGQQSLALPIETLSPKAVVADLVYAPLETDLLRNARQRGHRTADGLGMLLHQAVRGFALWFGKTPTVSAGLRAAVEADLTG